MTLLLEALENNIGPFREVGISKSDTRL
jgi:hypothetical protein